MMSPDTCKRCSRLLSRRTWTKSRGQTRCQPPCQRPSCRTRLQDGTNAAGGASDGSPTDLDREPPANLPLPSTLRPQPVCPTPCRSAAGAEGDRPLQRLVRRPNVNPQSQPTAHHPYLSSFSISPKTTSILASSASRSAFVWESSEESATLAKADSCLPRSWSR